MKTLTDLVCIIIEMMEGEEQKAFLEKMARGERPEKRPVPMTVAERWWKEKLHPDEEWATSIPVDDLLGEFIKATGWSKSRQGARTAMGRLLGKLCPAIRRYKGDYLMPTGKEARKAFMDVFPSPRRPEGLSRDSEESPKVLNIIRGPRI